MQDIKGHQREVDQFSDEAQTLQQITGEARVASSISQLLSRYQSLQHNIKVMILTWELDVTAFSITILSSGKQITAFSSEARAQQVTGETSFISKLQLSYQSILQNMQVFSYLITESHQ